MCFCPVLYGCTVLLKSCRQLSQVAQLPYIYFSRRLDTTIQPVSSTNTCFLHKYESTRLKHRNWPCFSLPNMCVHVHMHMNIQCRSSIYMYLYLLEVLKQQTCTCILRNKGTEPAFLPLPPVSLQPQRFMNTIRAQ